MIETRESVTFTHMHDKRAISKLKFQWSSTIYTYFCSNNSADLFYIKHSSYALNCEHAVENVPTSYLIIDDYIIFCENGMLLWLKSELFQPGSSCFSQGLSNRRRASAFHLSAPKIKRTISKVGPFLLFGFLFLRISSYQNTAYSQCHCLV